MQYQKLEKKEESDEQALFKDSLHDIIKPEQKEIKNEQKNFINICEQNELSKVSDFKSNLDKVKVSQIQEQHQQSQDLMVGENQKHKQFTPQIQVLNQNIPNQPLIQQNDSNVSAHFEKYKLFNADLMDQHKIKVLHSDCPNCHKRQNFINLDIGLWNKIILEHNYLKLQNRGIQIQKKFINKPTLQIIQSTFHARIVKLKVGFSYFIFQLEILNIPDPFSIFENQFSQLGLGSYGTIYQIIDKANIDAIAFKLIQILSNNPLLDQPQIFNIKPFLIQFCIYKLLSVLELGLKIPDTYGFDLICFQDSLMFPMELAKRISSLTKKQAIEVQPIFHQSLTQSLFFLHSLQILHQDIKPQNVMYSSSLKKMVLIDFGISDVITEKLGEKKMTSFVGTYEFCSSEMRNLFHKKNSEKIDMYWNDVQSLKFTINIIKKKIDLISNHEIMKNQEKNYEQFYEQYMNERMYNCLSSQGNESSILRSVNIFTSIMINKQITKQAYLLNDMIRLVYGLYVEDRKYVGRIVEKMKQQRFSALAINTIAEFMKDLYPTVKLYYIFTQSLKPIFTQTSSFQNNNTVSQLFQAYERIEQLSSAFFSYNYNIEQQNLYRFNIQDTLFLLTEKKRYLILMKVVVNGPENGDRFLWYMNFLQWLQMLNFYEDELNYVSQGDIHKVIFEFGFKCFKIDSQKIAVSEVLKKVLKGIWEDTKTYLDEYCSTKCDSRPHSHTQFYSTVNDRQFLKKSQYEAQRYDEFRKRSFPQSFVIYQKEFITEVMPQIMYKIAKTYERLQMYSSYLNYLKEYCLYTNSRKKLILSFYEVVKYTFMNYHSGFSLKKFLIDINFLFILKNSNIIPNTLNDTALKTQQKNNTYSKKNSQTLGLIDKNTNLTKKQLNYNQNKILFFEISKIKSINEPNQRTNEVKRKKREKQLQKKLKLQSFEKTVKIETLRNKKLETLSVNQKIQVRILYEAKENKKKTLQQLNQQNNSEVSKEDQQHNQNKDQKTIDCLNDFMDRIADKNNPYRQYLKHNQPYKRNQKSISGYIFMKNKNPKIDIQGKINIPELDVVILYRQTLEPQKKSESQNFYVNFYKMIIHQILQTNSQMSQSEAKLFNFIILILTNVHAQLTESQIDHKQLIHKTNRIQTKKKIQNSINSFIDYLKDQQCQLDKECKITFIMDLTFIMFDCCLYGQINEFVKLCEDFLENRHHNTMADFKRQSFYICLASKYHNINFELAKKLCGKIRKKNVFGMQSKHSYELLAQEAIEKLASINNRIQGEMIACRLLNYFLKKLYPQIAEPFDKKQTQNIFYERVSQLDCQLKFEEQDYGWIKLKSTLSMKALKSLQFFYNLLVSFDNIKFYYDAIMYALRGLNQCIEIKMNEKKLIAISSEIQQSYVAKLFNQLQKIYQRQMVLSISTKYNQININIVSELYMRIAHIDFHLTESQIQQFPCYYWLIKSQLLRAYFGKCYQVFYLDQFLMNEYYQKSLSTRITNIYQINSFHKKQSQDDSFSFQGSSNNKQTTKQAKQLKWKKTSSFKPYTTYFSPAIYQKWLRLSRDCNQVQYLNKLRRAHSDQTSKNQKSDKDQKPQKQPKTNIPLSSLLQSLNFNSIDTYYRHLSFYNYIHSNSILSAFMMPETLKSQTVMLECFLKYDRFELFHQHFVHFIEYLNVIKPHKGPIVFSIFVVLIRDVFGEIAQLDLSRFSFRGQKNDKILQFMDFIIEKQYLDILMQKEKTSHSIQLKNLQSDSQNIQNEQSFQKSVSCQTVSQSKQTKTLEEFLLILYLSLKCLTLLPNTDSQASKIKKLFLYQLNQLKRHKSIESLSQKSILKQIQIMTARRDFKSSTNVSVRCQTELSYEIEKICQFYKNILQSDQKQLKDCRKRYKINLVRRLTQLRRQEWNNLRKNWFQYYEMTLKDDKDNQKGDDNERNVLKADLGTVESRLNVKTIKKFLNINEAGQTTPI